jgi:hypothetical protein
MVAYRGWTVTAGTTKRLLTLTATLLLCAALGACSSFSGFVSDSWPTWAGGMPKDVPPRPGAPGYEEFIAHQQQHDAAAAPGTTSTVATPGAAPGATVAAAPGAYPAPPPPGPPARAAYPATTAAVPPATAQQPLPPAYARPDDTSATRGGLY